MVQLSIGIERRWYSPQYEVALGAIEATTFHVLRKDGTALNMMLY